MHRNYKFIIIFASLLFFSFFNSTFITSKGAATNLTPAFGAQPTIDGIIDRSNGEWDDAIKVQISLYPNLSAPQNPLTIDLWLLQYNKDLFISIQFEFFNHSQDPDYMKEFTGILISPNDSEMEEDFIDGRIVQFSNISQDAYEYVDYYINNSIYYVDDFQNGEGAARLSNDKVIYEFEIPIDNAQYSPQDAFLDYKITYAFKIIVGLTPYYPSGIIYKNIITIEPQFAPREPPVPLTEVIILVLNIIIFGLIGFLLFIYIIRVTRLKQKIRRLQG
jgi:hypothetical protein